MIISEVYHPQVTTIKPDNTIAEALEGIIDSVHNGYIVTDNTDTVVGVLSLQDIAAAVVPDEFEENPNLSLAMYKKGFFHERCQEIKGKKVKEIMRTNFIKVTLNTNILAVTADFLKNDLYIVPVIDQNKLVGIVTRTEIKKALALGMSLRS